MINVLWLAATGLLLAAEAPKIERIEIVEYGIYTASVEKSERDEKGILKSTLSEPKLVEATKEVPAKLGVRFGFRYKVIGSPKGEVVELKKVTTFPAPGLRRPGAAKPLTDSVRVLKAELGGDARYTDYGFDDEWELVEGKWTIELSDGERKLASQEFKVAAEGGESVDSAPPPPQQEAVSPRPGFVWVKGRWTHAGKEWSWLPGHWERAKEGKMWQDGRWEKRGSTFRWIDGAWVVR